MSTLQNGTNRAFRCVSAVLALALITEICTSANSSQPSPTLANNISFAREFLRSLYPDLSGKKYTLSISTAAGYDDPRSAIRNLELDVGDYPKDWVMGYAGGWVGEKPKDFQPGPIHPKQYLIANFGFGKDGLTGFVAKGQAVGNPDAKSVVATLVATQPEMPDAEADAALKRAGAKYGLADKQALLANLPLQRLEGFFGKIKVVSAELRALDTQSNDRDAYWPDWTVIAKGQRPDGHDVTITMYFEPFKGDLESLSVDAPR
jgi:hypothetical protein